MRKSATALFCVAVLLVAGCTSGGGDDSALVTSSAPGAVDDEMPRLEGPFALGRTPISGFGEVALRVITIDGVEQKVLCVLKAESSAQRQRGLMTVTDPELGGYDGMIFVFPEDIDGAFWMRNTPMPLSIAYLKADGSLVSNLDMEPCSDSPDCPGYPAGAPFRLALEVPQGRLEGLGIDAASRIELSDQACPAVIN